MRDVLLVQAATLCLLLASMFALHSVPTGGARWLGIAAITILCSGLAYLAVSAIFRRREREVLAMLHEYAGPVLADADQDATIRDWIPWDIRHPWLPAVSCACAIVLGCALAAPQMNQSRAPFAPLVAPPVTPPTSPSRWASIGTSGASCDSYYSCFQLWITCPGSYACADGGDKVGCRQADCTHITPRSTTSGERPHPGY